MIIFEGFSASGKGACLARAIHPLDPRYFDVYTMGKTNEDKQMRPFLWPFWKGSPAKGRIAFFDKSWHRQSLSHINKKHFYTDINAFARQLTDGGTLIIKFFLSITKEEQRKRFKELEKNPDTVWRVTHDDWEQNRRFEQHKKAFEKMIMYTSTGQNPWHVIKTGDKKQSVIRILETIINCINKRLRLEPAAHEARAPFSNIFSIKEISPYKTIEESLYKKELAYYQLKLTSLGHKLYTVRRSAVILFEGLDASGKGGSIKRLTEELDPRCYEVVPIGPPSLEELSHHYLWRFAKKFPKDGHFTIFDRSWYGRVLIERVDNLSPEPDWQRAYQEINEMESHLLNHGTILIKFWMHIDPEEQLNRFNARQNDPLKQYKITEADWHNREKWADYERAADEMLARTNMPDAPWRIIEANNKKYARIKVLKIVAETLEAAIKND